MEIIRKSKDEFYNNEALNKGEKILIHVENYSYYYKQEEIVYGPNIILSLNKVFHENELENLDTLINNIKDNQFFGIVFSDFAVYQIAKKYQIVHKLIYDPNTLVTNHLDFNFLADEIMGVFVSPFITLEDLKTIGLNRKTKLFFIGYGPINMFYSHRKLITNYFLSEKMEPKNYLDKILYLKEETREEQYPIIEKKGEVSIYTPFIFDLLSFAPALEEYIDYLYIDECPFSLPKTDGFLNKKTTYRR